MPPRLPTDRTKTDLGYEPDGRWRDVWVEVKPRTHSFRNVRASLLGLAYLLANAPKDRGLLVLADSRITEKRLKNELHLVGQTLRPDVAERLALVIEKDHGYVGIPDDLGKDFRAWLDALVRQETRDGKLRQSHYAVLEVLLHQWLLGKGPMTTDWIMKTIGCSYPTVARALRRLDHVLIRHSDRRVELRRFPSEDWARLVATSDEVRSTTRFADRFGQKRSPEALVRRLSPLERADLAVGGAIGARHYDPDLDLVGTPRLDLSLHCPAKRVDWSFVERLDPALEKTERRDEPAALAVHLVRRSVSLFQDDGGGLQWADPVECLLDLHEARLEAQAKEFLQFFSSKAHA
jgi:hypothetical protein